MLPSGPITEAARILPASAPPEVPSASALPRAKSAILSRLVLLTVVFAQVHLVGGPGSSDPEYEQSPLRIDFYQREQNKRAANERQELFRKRVPIPDAVGDILPTALPAVATSSPNEVTVPPGSEMTREGFLIAAFCLLSGILATRKLAPEFGNYLNQKLNSWVLAPSTGANFSERIRAEDDAFSEFLATFRTFPTASPAMPSAPANSAAERNPIEEFFANTPDLIGGLRKRLLETGRAANDGARRSILADLLRDVSALKSKVGLPELLPLWQLTSALEGLLKQLTDREVNITHSTLRTVCGGVDLLQNLCTPGLKADLLTDPPVRLLAVDDDLISRKAVFGALKRTFQAPELAENGEAALALANEHAYDVIFLDVQMPGMDGFEVCKKIHETVPNATTPVVFVTCMSDFEARAQSTISGGSDLIAKPFLTFEITLKALTLVMRRRLQSRTHAASSYHGLNGAQVLSPALAKTSPAQNPSRELCDGPAKAALPEQFANGQPQGRSLNGSPSPTDAAQRPITPPTAAAPNAVLSNSSAEFSSEWLTQAFLTRASDHLGSLRDLVDKIFQTQDENVRQEILGELYVRFNSLTPMLGSATDHPAVRMHVALDGLLKKLLQDPKHCTSSTLLTVYTAVDLMRELCAMGFKADLANSDPIRVLAADDDPVCRRAIACALQMTFEKPESVDSGEAALALASEKAYDVIFLDVQMPGMDGFTTCLRIKETVHNHTTPVVFVTGHSEFKARSQSRVSGGSGLIAKPFLRAEMTAKALTYALRGRLQKLKFAGCDLNPVLRENTSGRRESRTSRRSNRSGKRELSRSV